MSTTAFSEFLPEVMLYVPDCPQIVIINAIRNAAIEFCERSHIWQEDLSGIDVVADQGTYTVTLPVGSTLVGISTVWFDGRLLIPCGADQLTRLYRLTDWRDLKGAPAYYTRLLSSEIRLVPAPPNSEVGVLGIRAVLAPTRAAAGIETEIYDDYLEAIAAGARARLHGMVGQPFYDPNLAMMCRRDFLNGVGEAKIKANRGLTRAAGVVEFQNFG